MNNVNLSFINKLRESQKQLYMEMSMNEVESFEVKRETNHLIKLFNQSRINIKEYFLQIYRVLNPGTYNNLFDKIPSVIDINQIETSTIQSKKITSLISFVMDYGKVPGEQKQQTLNLKKKFFTDILTYSIIPSYYNFFWTEYSIKSLFKLFSYLRQKKDDDFYDSLARVGFSTPCFLRFARLCFQPIFCGLLSSHINIKNLNKENLIRDIQYNIKEYQYLIPDETLVVLACSSNPLRTLVQSFFTIALSSPISSQIFGFFHYSYNKKRFENILNFLRDIFSIKFCDSYIKSIMEAIICDTKVGKDQLKLSRYKQINNMYSDLFQNVNDFNEINDESQELNEYQITLDESNSSDLFGSLYSNQDNNSGIILDLYIDSPENNQNEELKKVNPIENEYKLFSLSNILNNEEIFRTKLLNTMDIQLIKVVSGNSKSFKIPKTIEYSIINDSKLENRFDQNNYINESTKLGRAFLIAPMIRHLLQRADPIPIFKKVPSDLSVLDFFYHFLVKRGDFSYLSERLMQFDQMKEFIPSNQLNIKTVENALSSISFKRKNPKKILSSFTSIEKKLLGLNEVLVNQFSEIQIVIEANDKIYVQFNALRKPYEYIKMPDLLADDFNSSDQQLKLSPDFNQTANLSKVLFASISERIDIETFSVQRDKLKKISHSLKEYDEMFSKKANSVFLDFLRDSFYSHCQNDSLNKFNKWSFLASKITCIPVEKKEIIEIITDAFKEISLMRKIERISIAMTTFLNYLSKGFPPDKILDSDELTPSFIAFIMSVNPPMVVTNLAFLHDMLPIKLDISNIFGGYASTFPNYLKFAVEQVIPELENVF